ncbi:MAG: hypothetical protein K2X73_02980 [Sphingomonas sp.]|uniref:hypothetical protein n=1 Tax=Sphingomonas sp. TaxID=28214 RepID=UPI0025D232F1|nr:hypothetical protein [Sphingomonas sp.]MBX9880916.1 hypothetical protein [Sphingomonas sp.]
MAALINTREALSSPCHTAGRMIAKLLICGTTSACRWGAIRGIIMPIAILLPIALLAAADGPPANDPPKKEKKICRTEPETGTMFPKRTCLTAKEWAEVDGSRSDKVDTFRRHPNFLQPPGQD